MQARRVRIAAKPLPSAIQPVAQSQQTQEQVQPPVTRAIAMEVYALLAPHLQAMIQELLSNLVTVDAYAAVVDETLKQRLATTPPPQTLTTKNTPCQELPDVLQQIKGAITILHQLITEQGKRIDSLQEQIKALPLNSTPPDFSAKNSVNIAKMNTPTPALEAGVDMFTVNTSVNKTVNMNMNKNEHEREQNVNKTVNKNAGVEKQIKRAMQILKATPDIPVRDLAKQLGVSTGCAHKRKQQAIERLT